MPPKKGAAGPPAAGGLTPYEVQREERILENAKKLDELAVPKLATAIALEAAAPAPKKRKEKAAPAADDDASLRRSSRASAAEATRRIQDRSESAGVEEDPPSSKRRRAVAAAAGEEDGDAGPEGGASLGPYTPKDARKPMADCEADPKAPQRDARGGIKFDDHPEFRPRLTPRQVIRAGTWGGCYFHPRGGKPGIKHPKGIDIDHKEFPAEWFAGLPEGMFRSRRYNVPTNKYGVKAGQDQKFWEEHGWINEQDPRGWFHWYCRFYTGRRTDDDERQISRWGRWKRALFNKIVAANAKYNDATISPVIRQTLLHWAFETTERDVQEHASK